MSKGALTEEMLDAHIETAGLTIDGRLAHVYKNADDLPAHLRPYLWEADFGMSFFKHRFMNQMFPLALPVPIEDMIAFRRQKAQEALEAGDYAQYLTRIERPWRLSTLLELRADGAFQGWRGAYHYWKLAAEFWVDAETDESDPIWGDILAADGDDDLLRHRRMMTPGPDRRRLARLPDDIVIWKGIQLHHGHGDPEGAAQEGHSWTLDRDIALLFAYRYLDEREREAGLVRAHIRKSDVIAFLSSRGEEEVIAAPGSASIEEIIRSPEKAKGGFSGVICAREEKQKGQNQ